MKHTIKCDKCGGGGTLPLPDHLAHTLQMLRTPKSATDMHSLVPSVSAGCFSNRLGELLALGFVKREKNGKFWRYSRA